MTTVYISSDAKTLGPDAEQADLDRYAQNLADHLAEKFGGEFELIVPPSGISEGITIHGSLFAFQKAVVQWALRRGRAAVWLDR